MRGQTRSPSGNETSMFPPDINANIQLLLNKSSSSLLFLFWCVCVCDGFQPLTVFWCSCRCSVSAEALRTGSGLQHHHKMSGRQQHRSDQLQLPVRENHGEAPWWSLMFQELWKTVALTFDLIKTLCVCVRACDSAWVWFVGVSHAGLTFTCCFLSSQTEGDAVTFQCENGGNKSGFQRNSTIRS